MLSKVLIDEKALKGKKLPELKEIGEDLGIKSVYKYRKPELIEEILKIIKVSDENLNGENSAGDHEESSQTHETYQENHENDDQDHRVRDDQRIFTSGLLEMHPDGYGFLRANRYKPGHEDTYVSPVQIRRFNLKMGDYVEGYTREARETEKFGPLIFVSKVNDDDIGFSIHRKQFEDLTPIYPEEKLVLEEGSDDLAVRLIDLVSPIGKGQRGMIVSPPKAGKTSLIKAVANSVVKSHPEMYVIVLLIDERPEEVTDISRSVVGDRVEIVSSTFDEEPSNHARISDFVLERAKRLVEHGKDVMILMDSITRLTRAYNVITPPSGRTLSGGLDPVSLNKPKKFFGAARNIENGGSLTILATALIDTGSRMDDVVYEEFKGTGNMEVHLDRALSEVRIFPAIDIYRSGTRRDDKLQSPEEMKGMAKIRKAMQDQSNKDIAQSIFSTLEKTKTNKDFLYLLEKTNL